MRLLLVTSLAALAVLLSLSGCGDGSSGSSSGGSLAFRPIWEQPATSGNGSALAVNHQVGLTTRAIFGTTLPPAVQTVRIVLEPDSGQSCCLSVNPDALPTDPVSGKSLLVLGELASGGATLSIAAFATDLLAPGDATKCVTDLASVGQSCDPTGLAAPSFVSDPTRVFIIGGIETDAGDIPAFAVPFLLNPNPAPRGIAGNPVSISFAVVDAGSGVNRDTIALDVTQHDVPVASAAVTASPCNDVSGGVQCSVGGALRVSGFLVTRAPQSLDIAPATLRVRATNLASRALDFTYSFDVSSAPVPTPTVTGGIRIVRPGVGTITAAVRSLTAGGMVIVAPGVYPAVTLAAGDVRGPTTLLGDVTGELTASAPASVVLNAGIAGPVLQVTDLADLTVDGFTFRGGSNAGILLRRDTRMVIRNSVVSATNGDGIRIENSQTIVLFDNLVANPSGTGIRVLGAQDLQVVNNTVYNSLASGLVVGPGDAPSDGVIALNNIFNLNRPLGISVVASTVDYDGDFNLNTDGYGAGTPIGSNDLVGAANNPLFNLPSVVEGFHLSSGSPAIDAGDPSTDPGFVSILAQRTTQVSGAPDAGFVDLGYHYPIVSVPTPTP